VVEPFRDQTHAIVQHEDPGRRGRAPGQIHEHDVAVVQGGQHAVALDMHDPEIRRLCAQLVADPGALEVVGLALLLLVDDAAAAHRSADRHRGDGDKGLVGVLEDRGLALDLAEAVQQPPALDLEHLGDAIEALEAGMLRASAHDVVHE
jgi:hypothetical protein